MSRLPPKPRLWDQEWDLQREQRGFRDQRASQQLRPSGQVRARTISEDYHFSRKLAPSAGMGYLLLVDEHC
jgi:hypothetical protein